MFGMNTVQTKYYGYHFARPIAMQSGVVYGLFSAGVMKSTLTPAQAALVSAGLFLTSKALTKIGKYLVLNKYVPNRLTFDQVKCISWLCGKDMFTHFNGGGWFQYLSDVKEYLPEKKAYTFDARYMADGKLTTGSLSFSKPKHFLSTSEQGVAVVAGTIALMVFKAFTLKEAFVHSFVIYAAGTVGQKLFEQDLFSSIYLHGAIHKVKTTFGFSGHGIDISIQTNGTEPTED